MSNWARKIRKREESRIMWRHGSKNSARNRRRAMAAVCAIESGLRVLHS